jgi:lysophospholipase L1-like esterase
MAMAMFDTWANPEPRLHLWVQLDGGAMVQTPIDSYLRIRAPTDGRHVCRIIYKGGAEVHPRWYLPIEGKVSFIGFEAEKCVAIGEDTRKTIEFVGDSITEGVLIDTDYYGEGHSWSPIDQHNRVYQDDACATYAWLTAEALDLRPIVMGYGAVGVTRAGQRKVPPAPVAYPYNFEDSPISRPEPDYILINHGANDAWAGADRYIAEYEHLLDVIRECHPTSKIISTCCFRGHFKVELEAFINKYNEKNETDIIYIDASSWIPYDPLHPLRDGHRIVAENLAPVLKEKLGL